jgi:plasmid stabilization system protein ParE
VSQGYQLTPSAQRDVDGITDFIADDNVEAALRVHDALEEAFRHLAEMPAMGHTREDLTERPVKFWSVYSYLVVYDPASSPLTVVAVLHGARDVENILKW